MSNKSHYTNHEHESPEKTEAYRSDPKGDRARSDVDRRSDRRIHKVSLPSRLAQ